MKDIQQKENIKMYNYMDFLTKDLSAQSLTITSKVGFQNHVFYINFAWKHLFCYLANKLLQVTSEQ